MTAERSRHHDEAEAREESLPSPDALRVTDQEIVSQSERSDTRGHPTQYEESYSVCQCRSARFQSSSMVQDKSQQYLDIFEQTADGPRGGPGSHPRGGLFFGAWGNLKANAGTG